MKLWKIIVPALLVCKSLSAQIVVCDTMSLGYVSPGVRFIAAPLSTPDSAVVIPMINNTHTDFAYPQIKLINTTPLPTGMTLYDANWQVFASAWNVGDTAKAYVSYYVTTAIPDNYMVTFQLYAHNFAPLSIDSCIFSSTVTVNLKPTGTATVKETGKDSPFSFYPNPAGNFIYVTAATGATIDIYSPAGVVVQTEIIHGANAVVDISRLPAGVYFIREKGSGKVSKLIRTI